MRLFLLPISNKRTLIYCKRLNQQLTSEQTYVEKVTSRASTTWVKWEGAQGGWQKQLTVWGNQLFKRIPFEEWGLKSIPPLNARRAVKDVDGEEDIEVIYPSSIIKPGRVLDVLQRLATERQALHRRSMWGSIIGMPVTLPFGLIPILPNIPFFYLVFRAWSHWRALSGSRHVEYLLKHGLIKSVPSRALSSFYALEVVKEWGLAAAEECGVLKQEYERRFPLPESNDTLSEKQEIIDKHWKLIVKYRFVLAAHEEFCKNRSEFWGAGEGKEADEVVATYKGMVEILKDTMEILQRSFSNETFNADLETQVEALDEQMLLSAGQGAEIGKLLGNYEGASEVVVEVERAIEQVRKDLSAKAELKSFMKELPSATKTGTNDAESKH